MSQATPPWMPSFTRWKTPNGDELLRVRIGDVGVLVAVELAVDALIADLVAHRRERHFEAGVEAFVEAEVAAVAVLIVRAFEALHAAEEHQFLPLGHADADRRARLADRLGRTCSRSQPSFGQPQPGSHAQPISPPQPQPQPGSQPHSRRRTSVRIRRSRRGRSIRRGRRSCTIRADHRRSQPSSNSGPIISWPPCIIGRLCDLGPPGMGRFSGLGGISTHRILRLEGDGHRVPHAGLD